jgi:hypothetical protein
MAPLQGHPHGPEAARVDSSRPTLLRKRKEEASASRADSSVFLVISLKQGCRDDGAGLNVEMHRRIVERRRGFLLSP